MLCVCVFARAGPTGEGGLDDATGGTKGSGGGIQHKQTSSALGGGEHAWTLRNSPPIPVNSPLQTSRLYALKVCDGHISETAQRWGGRLTSQRRFACLSECFTS
eukprot:9466812-Pyramimonas_sp.AAC.1